MIAAGLHGIEHGAAARAAARGQRLRVRRASAFPRTLREAPRPVRGQRRWRATRSATRSSTTTSTTRDVELGGLRRGRHRLGARPRLRAPVSRVPSPPPTPSLASIFAPVRSQTAFEETLERLGTAIKLGLLEPGDRLPAERELCGRLGIARSTLRQALTALVQSGHLHAVRGRGGGTFVAESPPRRRGPVGRVAGRLARRLRRAPGGRARRRRARVRARQRRPTSIRSAS